MIGHPLLGLSFLTLLLTAYFVTEGIWKIIASFSYRSAKGWLCVMASGLVTLALGVVIWQQWPLSGLWAVGTLVGINLVVTGAAMIALAFTAGQSHAKSEEAAAN